MRKNAKVYLENQDPIVKELCDALMEGIHLQDINTPRIQIAREAFYTKYGHIVSRRRPNGKDNGL